MDRKKKTWRWIVALSLIVLVGYFLLTVGENLIRQDPPSEDKVKEAVLENDQELKTLGLTSLQIKQVGKAYGLPEGTEEYIMTATGETGSFYFSKVYHVTYVRDPLFWEQTDFSAEEAEYVSKTDCDESIVREALKAWYPYEITSMEITKQDGGDMSRCRYACTVMLMNGPVCQMKDIAYVVCECTGAEGWQVTDISGALSSDGFWRTEKWLLEGDYAYSDEDVSVDLHVEYYVAFMNTDFMQAKITYSIKSDLTGEMAVQEEPLAIETGAYLPDVTYGVYRVEDMAEIYFCGKEVDWETVGPGVGIWVRMLDENGDPWRDFWLTKQA